MTTIYFLNVHIFPNSYSLKVRNNVSGKYWNEVTSQPLIEKNHCLRSLVVQLQLKSHVDQSSIHNNEKHPKHFIDRLHTPSKRNEQNIKTEPNRWNKWTNLIMLIFVQISTICGAWINTEMLAFLITNATSRRRFSQAKRLVIATIKTRKA